MIKNRLKNSIYAEMWKENPEFREGIKRSLQILAFAVFLFVFGSIKGCCVEKKAEKAQQASVQVQKNKIVNMQKTFNVAYLFKQKHR